MQKTAEMTKELLKQYPAIKAELEELGEVPREARNGLCPASFKEGRCPCAQGLAAALPPSPESERLLELLSERRRELYSKREKIETFLNSIDDPQLRRIITLRFLEGKSWNAVADAVGGSEDSVRKAVERYLKAKRAS